jgi:hypothetical protein
MKTFTIDAENAITVFASKKEAAAVSGTPFDPFTSQSELAELSAEWPASRLIAIWNSIPGVLPVKKFTDRKVATDRIWKAIQSLELPQAEPAVETPEQAVIEAPVEEPAAPATDPLPEAEAEPAIAEEQPIQEAVIETEPVTAEELPNTGDETPDTAPVTPEPTTDEEGAQGQEGREGRGSCRSARRQQHGAGGSAAEAGGRSHAGGDHAADGLAEAHRARVHGWRDEESGVRGRVLQVRQGRAFLPHQSVAFTSHLSARPAPAAAGISASGSNPANCAVIGSFGRYAGTVRSAPT